MISCFAVSSWRAVYVSCWSLSCCNAESDTTTQPRSSGNIGANPPLPGNLRACKWSIQESKMRRNGNHAARFSSPETSFKHAHTHDRTSRGEGGARREHTRARPVIGCIRHTASVFWWWTGSYVLHIVHRRALFFPLRPTGCLKLFTAWCLMCRMCRSSRQCTSPDMIPSVSWRVRRLVRNRTRTGTE